MLIRGVYQVPFPRERSCAYTNVHSAALIGCDFRMHVQVAAEWAREEEEFAVFHFVFLCSCSQLYNSFMIIARMM